MLPENFGGTNNNLLLNIMAVWLSCRKEFGALAIQSCENTWGIFTKIHIHSTGMTFLDIP